MYCEKCGNQISDDSVFCEICGAKQGEGAAADSQAGSSEVISAQKETPTGNFVPEATAAPSQPAAQPAPTAPQSPQNNFGQQNGNNPQVNPQQRQPLPPPIPQQRVNPQQNFNQPNNNWQQQPPPPPPNFNNPQMNQQNYNQQYQNPGYVQSNGPSQDELRKPLSVWWFLLMFIVMAVPILGIVMTFVWAFGSKTNLNRKNFARAVLILAVISIVLGIVFYGSMAAIFGSMMSNFDYGGFQQ